MIAAPRHLVDRVLAGDVRATAQLMRDLDDRLPEGIEALRRLFRHTGRAHVVGITGPPGAGKSTLTDRLIGWHRARGRTVGVVAVDPTSPFTGGAILGDRIRMNRHADDEGVFIRSLATRGYLGGVSRSTGDVALVLDAMGMDVVIIETVGVGQDEVDIVRMAHTTAVVMVPGLGDDIQAIKAGILEIGDVFVVNKADRPDADRTVRELTTMLEMNNVKQSAWKPRVIKTEANRGTGIEELVDEFEAHCSYLFNSRAIDHFLTDKYARTFMDMLKDRLFSEVFRPLQANGTFERIVEDMVARRVDPYTAVEEIVAKQFATGSDC